MRLFSIIQWHHFAYMVISLALLGYGASGSIVAIFLPRLRQHGSAIYTACIGLFGISAIGCFLITQSLPFNAEELLWDSSQPLILLAMFLLLAVPFFFAASAIAIALSSFPQSISRLYAFDLFGAGLGGLVIIFLLFVLLPMQVLAAVALLGMIAAIVAALELGFRKLYWIALASAVPFLAVFLLAISTEPKLSPYKEMQQLLRIGGTEVVQQRSSPMGLLSVVKSSQLPLRHAPGLSLNASVEPPEQLAVFTDGGGMSVITRDRPENNTQSHEEFAYLDQMTSALPYHLVNAGKVLILGAGGGSDVLQAQYQNARDITAVELNPQMAALVEKEYQQFSGDLYGRDNFELVVGDARGFVSQTNRQYDLIQVPSMDAFGASSAGLYSLNENYLYTTESLSTMLEKVSPGGFLSINRWIRLPPRDTLKMFAMALEVLRQGGVNNPENRIVLVRSWQTSTLLIKNGEISAGDIDTLKRFCEDRSFDVSWYPGISEKETNRFNQLNEPLFYQSSLSLIKGEKDVFFNDYKFDIRPASDDRPYFFHFFKWKTLAEIFSLRASGGMSLLEQGYLISVVTLFQALLVSGVLILLPLWFLKKNQEEVVIRSYFLPVLMYFSAIGLAFLFIEIAFIQKFILLLNHPVYSVATVMSSFLFFAGLGSLFSQRLEGFIQAGRLLPIIVMAIGILATGYMLLFTHLPAEVLSWSWTAKVLLSVVLIGPLAFFMGMPFPIALTSLGVINKSLIPWAWAINGFASVISAILATILAIHFGFTAVIMSAVLLYAVAAISFWERK